MGGKVERFAGGWAVGATTYDFGGEDDDAETRGTAIR